MYQKRSTNKHLNPNEAMNVRDEACAHSIRTCLIVRLMLEAGLRACEISTLRTKDLSDISRENLPGGVIVYRLRVKGKWRHRYDEYIYLSQRFYDLLLTFSSRRRIYVFEGRGGKPLTTRQIRNIVKRPLVAAKCGEHSAHHLRHTYAKLMYDATGNLPALKKQLRHKSISLTAYYAGVLMEATGENEALHAIIFQD
jgi:integrase